MSIRLYGQCALVISVCLLGTSACSNRGTFTPEACASEARVGVPADAVAAVYFDMKGNAIGAEAETLKGTQKNLMCPTPPAEGGGGCPANYCVRNINGKNYCLPC